MIRCSHGLAQNGYWISGFAAFQEITPAMGWTRWLEGTVVAHHILQGQCLCLSFVILVMRELSERGPSQSACPPWAVRETSVSWRAELSPGALCHPAPTAPAELTAQSPEWVVHGWSPWHL